MSLDYKALKSLAEADLVELIDNGASEGRTIDYKREVQVAQDGDKKEFLADISSFANTMGGSLVFGMEEQDGAPISLPGFASEGIDSLILRLENIIRDGLDPRVIGFHSQPVSLQNGNIALVIRVPKSFTAPHMVKFKDSSRFYARNSRGKYQLDASEIRQAFLLSDTLARRIEDFHLARLAALVANEALYPLPEGGKIVLHVVPVSTYAQSGVVDLAQVDSTQDLWENLLPMASSQWDRRYNLEGWLMHSVVANQPYAGSYTQLFRNGTVEMVDASLIARNSSGAFWERHVLNALNGVLNFYRKSNIQPPFVVMLSYLDVKECQASGVHPASRPDSAHPVERDNLICDPLWVNDEGKNAGEILMPAFDVAWNSCGYPKYRHD